MSIIKQAKDYFVKFFWDGSDLIPSGLFELSQYFRNNDNIEFEYKKEGDGIVAISKNFVSGSIIATAKDQNKIDQNIKDAILTSFDVPSSYAKEVNIRKVGSKATEKKYALA